MLLDVSSFPQDAKGLSWMKLVAHSKTKTGLCLAACCLLALYVKDFTVSFMDQGRALHVGHPPGDLPEVIAETQRILAPLKANLSNPLRNQRNKGRILLDFQGEPPHEGKLVTHSCTSLGSSAVVASELGLPL